MGSRNGRQPNHLVVPPGEPDATAPVRRIPSACGMSPGLMIASTSGAARPTACASLYRAPSSGESDYMGVLDAVQLHMHQGADDLVAVAWSSQLRHSWSGMAAQHASSNGAPPDAGHAGAWYSQHLPDASAAAGGLSPAWRHAGLPSTHPRNPFSASRSSSLGWTATPLAPATSPRSGALTMFQPGMQDAAWTRAGWQLLALPAAAMGTLVLALWLLGVSAFRAAPGALSLFLTCWLQCCWRLMAPRPRAFLRLGQATAVVAGVVLLLPQQRDIVLLKDSGAGATVAQLQLAAGCMLFSWALQIAVAAALGSWAACVAPSATLQRSLVSEKSHVDMSALARYDGPAQHPCLSSPPCPLWLGPCLQRAALWAACASQLAVALLCVTVTVTPLERVVLDGGSGANADELASAAGPSLLRALVAKTTLDCSRTLTLAGAVAAPLLHAFLAGSDVCGTSRQPSLLTTTSSVLLRPATSQALSHALWDGNCSKLLLALATAALWGCAKGMWAWQLLQVATLVLGAAGLYVEGVRSQHSFSCELGGLVPSPAATRNNAAAAGAGVAGPGNGCSSSSDKVVKVPLLVGVPSNLYNRSELVSRGSAAASGSGANNAAITACAAVGVDAGPIPGSPTSVSSVASYGATGSGCPSTGSMGMGGATAIGPVAGGHGCSSGGTAALAGCSPAAASGSGPSRFAASRLAPLMAASGREASGAAPTGCCYGSGGEGCGEAGLGYMSALATPWSQLLMALAASTALLWLVLLTAPLAFLGDDPADTYLGALEEGPLTGVVVPTVLVTGVAMVLVLLTGARVAARGELRMRLAMDREEGRRLQVLGWAAGLALAVALCSAVSWGLGEERNVTAFAVAEGLRCAGVWPLVWLLEPWLLVGVESVGGCEMHAGCGATCRVLRWVGARRTARAGTPGARSTHVLDLEGGRRGRPAAATVN